jgi:DNA-binding MarR family transcriptional regulator
MNNQLASVDAATPHDKFDIDRRSDEAKRNVLLVAQELYRVRRVRARKFGADAQIFGDPGWDILLSLYIAHCNDSKITRSSAAMAGENPESTGFRILKDLEKRGFVQNENDSSDKRRIFVSLTERGCSLMRSCLQDCRVTSLEKLQAE